MKATAATEIAATELTAANAELSGNAELTASNAELTAANAELTATTVELTATTANAERAELTAANAELHANSKNGRRFRTCNCFSQGAVLSIDIKQVSQRQPLTKPGLRE